MATNFSDVYDQFMMLVSDYRLIELYNASTTDFETYLFGWLKPSISDFKSCSQSLAYTGTAFDETLTNDNIVILASFMKKYWLKKEIADITQMSLHVQDRDFKTYAESSNLREKRETYIQDLEELSQRLVDYGLDTVDWDSWFAGTYFSTT